MALPPGSRAPRFVQSAKWLLDPTGALEVDFHRYGGIYTVQSLLFGCEVVITRPETIKQVFTGDPSVYLAGEANKPLIALLGESSVLVLDGDAHLRQRRLMMPAFHGEGMKSYTDIMRDATARHIEGLKPGDEARLHPLAQRIALDVILRAVLGLSSGPALEKLARALTRLLDRVQSPLGAFWMMPAMRKDLGPLTGWAAIKRALKEADDLLFDHIAQRRAEAGGERRDVLAMLMEAVDEEGRHLSDQELRDELITLLVAGHETSATVICWAFEEILRSPGEQGRLREEVARVVGAEPLASDHIPKLVRLDAAIKESLRLHPPTAAVGRRLTKPVTLEGYEIPAGVLVVPCMYLTHRRPDLYPEPDRFKPERFIDKKTDPYEWLPFGGGTRRCLGMAFAMHEMRVVMAEMLRRMELRLKKQGPIQTVLRSLLYAPKGGTAVVIESVSEPRAASATRAATAA